MSLDRFQGVNAGFVLERYRRDPESVDAATRETFRHWSPDDLVTPETGGGAPPARLQETS